ncbi:TPA: hypothetical protein L4E92_004390 [Pseudomonas aeruginosa]|nr:hypothetical protein [Pseudomonas aeruginosa]
MERWSLSELKDLCFAVFPKEVATQIYSCAQSLADRKFFAQYHYNEYKIILDEYVAGRSDLELLPDVFGFGRNEDGAFEWAFRRAKSHVYSSLQSLHAVADTLAFLVYLVCELEGRNLIKRKRFYSADVVKALDGDLFPEIYVLLKGYVESARFEYLSALVNRSKHVSVVDAPFTFDFTGREAWTKGLRFSSFVHGEEEYPARWVEELLPSETRIATETMLRIGKLLNTYLAEKKLSS